MIGEVDHHCQAGEQQHDGAADREPREVLGSLAGLHADGEQSGRAVDEGGYEHAEDHLGPRSRRKLRSSRGENWVEESWSATTVRPRTSAMTVTTVLVMEIREPRASSAVPWKASQLNLEPGVCRPGRSPSRRQVRSVRLRQVAPRALRRRTP